MIPERYTDPYESSLDFLDKRKTPITRVFEGGLKKKQSRCGSPSVASPSASLRSAETGLVGSH